MKICGLVLTVIMILGIVKFWKRKTFIILAAAGILCFAAAAANEAGLRNTAVHSIEKNENGEGSSQKEMTAVTHDGREIEIKITIPERGYTQSEARKILEAEANSLDKRILGQNGSFDDIRYDMELPGTGTAPGVSIKWQSSDPHVIDQNGKIQGGLEDEAYEIEMTAVLTLQEEEERYSKRIKVYPESDSKSLEDELQKEIDRRSLQDGSADLVLPDSLDGSRLVWYEKPRNTAAVTAFMLLVSGVLLHIDSKQKASEKIKKREELLKREYPEFVCRLLLMLYSGTGVRNAFFRIAALYDSEKENRHIEIFEEVAAACRQMQNGSSEDEAYEKMAERCRLPCYRKLSVLLIQNRKRGGKGFTDELEREVMVALADKKRRAETAGEAASLKLLIPLGMMLAVVLALMMIPAFMAV
jgi:tight adherence protein C